MMIKVKETAARFLRWMDDWLFPEKVLCLCCEHAIVPQDSDGICKSCAAALERLAAQQELREQHADRSTLPSGLEYVHAAYPYEAQVKVLVHRLKYHSVRAAAVPLAARMVYLPSGEEEIIVPVPTDKRRELRRGFNQSAVLADHLGKALGMQVERALVRTRRCQPQTGLPAEKRKVNVAGCMAAQASVKGRRVLLVDDVYTTGATLAEAARALKQAGAVSVGAFAAARALDGDDGQKDPFQIPQRR